MKNKGWIVELHLVDDITMLRFFKLIRIGLIHPKGEHIKGIFFGISRLEAQLTFVFWPKKHFENRMGEDIGRA